MGKLRWIGIGAVAGCIAAPVLAQRAVPLADDVAVSLTPSTISHLAIGINGPLAYLFEDADGSDVLHVLGGFSLSLGNGQGLRLAAREGVVWLSPRELDGKAYTRLEVMLWRDASIQEVAGTVTEGPAMFVTLDTFGDIRMNVDEVAYADTAEAEAYTDGLRIREAVNAQPKGEAQQSTSLRVVDASGLGTTRAGAKPRPVIQYRSSGELKAATTPDGRPVYVDTGGMYLSRGVPGTDDFLEIRADSIVLFFPPPRDGSPASAPRPAGLGGENPRPDGQPAAPSPTGASRSARDRQMFSSGLGEVPVDAAYLEGDVVMSQGPNSVRASRLYYDFVEDRAILLDAVVRTALADRNIPLYLRAAEIRQLSRSHYTATDAVLTTSEFHTPHYHVGAQHVDLLDVVPVTAPGRTGASASGSFRVRHATLNFENSPVLYWPYVQGNLDTSETAIKSLRLGYSDDFGFEFESEWHFFNVLGLKTPRGVSAVLSVDEYTRRGPGVGVDAKYDRDRYYGVLRSYLLADSGEDSLGRERERDSQHDARGRILIRHRQYLENDWQLSLELAHISDKNFLEEFFEPEFDNEKDQETLLHLKKQTDHQALTGMLQYRLLDFTTQTERLPDFAYFLMGEPVASRFVWFSEDRAGLVRYRTKDQSFREFLRDGPVHGSGTVARVDSRQELEAPVDLGPVRVVPFTSVRGSVWDDSAEGGGLQRVFGTYGIRGTMYISRVSPEARSTILDLDGIRHVIKPEFVAWGASTSVDAHELYAFDQTVEAIDEIDGAALSVRQRWQTRRGEGANRRTVDFLTLDLGTGFFNDAGGRFITNGYTSPTRPEESLSRNYVNGSAIWRFNDRTALLSEINYDVNDGAIGVWNVSVAMERPPRLSYLLGYRFINKSNSNLLGFDLNYRLTEKHSVAVRESFDLARGRTVDFTIALIRKFPRWFGAMSFALDEAEDDFGVSFSVWPEGLPQAALGSRRFTGVTSLSHPVGD